MHVPPISSHESDEVQLEFLDGLTEALLGSLSLHERLEATLDFFVPKFASAATIEVPDGTRHSRGLTVGRPTGRERIAIPLRIADDFGGWLELEGPNVARDLTPATLRAFGRRISAAIRHAVAFEREQRAAFAFQHAAISKQLPQLPHFRLDGVYEAGSTEALIGGDWYDSFVLDDGRLVVSIGDVVGSGLRAAVAMVSIRQSLRTVAHLHPDPQIMLEAANRALIDEFPDRFATTFLGVIDPVTQTCIYANAGHPPPYIRLPDGSIVQLPPGGLPLGLPDFNEHLRVSTHQLEPGSLLLLYTDGLTEANRNMLEGEERVRQALQAVDQKHAHPANAVYRFVLHGRPRDDVALLSVTFDTVAALPRWRFDPRWPDVAQRARGEMCRALTDAGFEPDDIIRFQLIFSELAANIVRHAPGIAEFFLQARADRAVLHVLDKGPGFHFSPRLPNDLFSEQGRGIFLISKISDDLRVERRPGGGSHTRVTLTR